MVGPLLPSLCNRFDAEESGGPTTSGLSGEPALEPPSPPPPPSPSPLPPGAAVRMPTVASMLMMPSELARLSFPFPAVAGSDLEREHAKLASKLIASSSPVSASLISNVGLVGLAFLQLLSAEFGGLAPPLPPLKMCTGLYVSGLVSADCGAVVDSGVEGAEGGVLVLALALLALPPATTAATAAGGDGVCTGGGDGGAAGPAPPSSFASPPSLFAPSSVSSCCCSCCFACALSTARLIDRRLPARGPPCTGGDGPSNRGML